MNCPKHISFHASKHSTLECPKAPKCWLIKKLQCCKLAKCNPSAHFKASMLKHCNAQCWIFESIPKNVNAINVIFFSFCLLFLSLVLFLLSTLRVMWLSMEVGTTRNSKNKLKTCWPCSNLDHTFFVIDPDLGVNFSTTVYVWKKNWPES
jgi:hypothetical protein